MHQKASKTSSSFYTNSSNKLALCGIRGYPYTKYPVSVSQQPIANNNNCIFGRDPLKNKLKQNRCQSDAFKMQAIQNKYILNNPGLRNANRKININLYDQSPKSSQTQAIRRYGMNYRKKLQKQYNSPHSQGLNTRNIERKSVMNHEKAMQAWYEQRNQMMRQFHLNYIKKVQKQLADNGKAKAEEIFNSENKLWNDQSLREMKKCFQI